MSSLTFGEIAVLIILFVMIAIGGFSYGHTIAADTEVATSSSTRTN